NSPDCNVFLLRVVVFAPRKHHAFAFVSESKMLRIPFAHLITISGFEEDTADSKDAPALFHFDRRLRRFRLRRLHFLFSFRGSRDEQQRAERNRAPRYSVHVWSIQVRANYPEYRKDPFHPAWFPAPQLGAPRGSLGPERFEMPSRPDRSKCQLV